MIAFKQCFILSLSLVLGGLSFGQTFTGNIYSSVDSTRVPFAKIYFIDLGTTIYSDEEGKWAISEAPIGINHVIIAASGFETLHLDIHLEGTTPTAIYLHPTHHQLDKVIVSNNGYLHRESITNVESVQLNELNTIPVTTIGEAIGNIPGVYQTGIGTGISKPVIRGLSGSSVITYVNSLRIENQQWGNDHGLPVTSLGIGSVEVIKGPASLLFGADAMGGVLYFVDEPYAERNKLSGYVKSRFEHNSLGTSNEAGIKYSSDKIRLNFFGGYDNYADYGIPNGNQILNSRFNQYSGKLALGLNRKKWVMNLRYNFYQGRLGLPGHTHDSLPDALSFQTESQNRAENVPAQSVQNHLISLENKLFFRNQEVIISLGNTNNSLKEYEEKFYFPAIVMNLNNSLYTIKWRVRMSNFWEAMLGSQGMIQLNSNAKDAEEILIPDSRTTDAGLYGLLRCEYKKWRILIGGRFDHRQLNAYHQENFSASYSGINYSSGFAYLGKKSTFRLNISSGFRAPTASELLSDGVHHGSFRYEIGNSTLTTQKAIQLDASYGLHFDDFELLINPFANRISNYIFLDQTDSVTEGFTVFEYKQAPFALLYGVDFGFHYHPHFAHWLHIESNLSNVFAEDNQKNPLPLIPQSRINSQLKFEFNTNGVFKVENMAIQYIYFFKQNRLGQLETESPAYHILNIGVNMKLDLKHPLFLAVGARNILNYEYIDHLSGLKNLGLPAPGYNIYFSLTYKFNHDLKIKKP